MNTHSTPTLAAVAPATTFYRLLNFDDEIEGSDEFLEDDAVTWTRLDIQHRWNVGGWWHANLKPMRRKIPCDNPKKIQLRLDQLRLDQLFTDRPTEP